MLEGPRVGCRTLFSVEHHTHRVGTSFDQRHEVFVRHLQQTAPAGVEAGAWHLVAIQAVAIRVLVPRIDVCALALQEALKPQGEDEFEFELELSAEGLVSDVASPGRLVFHLTEQPIGGRFDSVELEELCLRR